MINTISSKKNDVSNNISSKNGNFDYGSVANGRKNVSKISEFFPNLLPLEKMSNNRILKSLPEHEAGRLLPHLDFVLLEEGKEIYAAGELNPHVYFPETTVISDVSDLKDGNTIETAMVGKDSATGLCAILGLNPTNHRAQTIIKGNAWRIKSEILKQEFNRGGKLQTLLLDCVNRHINQISQRLICKSFHLVEKRLCAWLLMLHDRVGRNRLKLTQENTALLLGANRPTITVTAQLLRSKGFIDYSRGGLIILDRSGLEESACECYQILQLDDCIH